MSAEGVGKATAGPWVAHVGSGKSGASVTTQEGGSICALRFRNASFYVRALPRDEMEANARLIAEAGTVLHETGKSPRQLQDALLVSEQERSALADEVERLRADAARYRFLRDHCVEHPSEYGEASQIYFGTFATGAADAAIDRALAEQQQTAGDRG